MTWKIRNKAKGESNQKKLKTCDECNASFKKACNRDRHYMNVHYKQKYECPECLQLFGRQDNLNKHRKYIHEHEVDESVDEDDINEDVMERDPDDFEISGSSSVKWKCNGCDKDFSSKFNLGVHKKKMYQCENCEKSFCSNKILKVHRKFKHGTKPFECKNCLETFSSKRNLERHDQASKVVSCDECGAKLCNSRSTNFHKHKHWMENFRKNKY